MTYVIEMHRRVAGEARVAEALLLAFDGGVPAVAGRLAGQHQVVGPIIGRLPPAGPHVVQGDLSGGSVLSAVGADGAVPGEEPFPVGTIPTSR
jgi:hypothetical protein